MIHKPSPTSGRSTGVVEGSNQPTELLSGLLAATSNGIVVEHYLTAYNAGATHQEILEAYAAHLFLDQYARARTSGVSHTTILELDLKARRLLNSRKGVRLPEMIGMLEAGISLAEVLEVRALKCRVRPYIGLRQAGATHSQLISAARAGISLADYAFIYPTASHAELMQAKAQHANMPEYVRQRSEQCSHVEALIVSTPAP